MNQVQEASYIAVYVYRYLSRDHYFAKSDTDESISSHLARLTQNFYDYGFNDPSMPLHKCVYSFVCAHLTSYPSFGYYKATAHEG